MSYRWGIVAGLAFFATGCADRTPDGLAPRQPELDVRAVARAVAQGMAAPDVRATVRDAMRSSPYTEHKLSFQTFLASSDGETLSRAAARAAGTGLGSFRAAVARLPELDFYIPAVQQRLTWRGTADYVVAVSMSGIAPKEGYREDGGTLPLDLSQTAPPPVTVVMLQTAEPKSPRVAPQAARPGLVIQDRDDGQLSGTLVVTDRFGATKTVNFADLVKPGSGRLFLQECYEDCGGGGGGGSPPPPQTFLESIYTDGVCDNGNCGEGNEFEFRATSTVPGGPTEAIRIEGVPSTGLTYLHTHLIYALPPMWVGGENGNIAARETDSFNTDDWWFFTDANYCGAVQLNSADDNGVSWYLTEGTCDPFAFKNLIVRYVW